MIESIKAFHRSLPGWAQYWIQRLAIGVVAALVSSVWMHVAVYAYALRHGARFPLEGVSFVALLGALAGFVLALASMFLFYDTPRQLRQFHVIVIEDNIRRTHSWKSRLTANLAFVVVPMLVLSVGLGGINFAAIMAIAAKVDDFANWAGLVANLALIFVGMLPVVLAVNFPDPESPWPRKIVMRLYAVVVIGVATAALFSPFDAFLRLIRFGGGLPVQIISEDGRPSPDACLFLVSDGAVTIYDKPSDKFIEYRRDAITEVRYSPRAPDCAIPTRQGNAVPVPSPDKPVSVAVRSSPMFVCCGGKC